MTADTRRATNPLFNDNKLKLGTFGTNVSNGCAITTVAERFVTTWPNTLAVAQEADRQGFEALVPVARWKGFGGETNFNGTNFETYTWAARAGPGDARTPRSSPPRMSRPSIRSSPPSRRPPSTISATAASPLTSCAAGSRPSSRCSARRSWHTTRATNTRPSGSRSSSCCGRAEEEFDYEGKFLRVTQGLLDAEADPAAVSAADECGLVRQGPAFRRQICRHGVHHLRSRRPRQDQGAYRQLPPPRARGIWPRRCRSGATRYVVQRETRKEAEDYVQLLRRREGRRCGGRERSLRIQGEQDAAPAAAEARAAEASASRPAGAAIRSSAPPTTSSTSVIRLSRLGIDGILLNWVDYLDGLRRWRTNVMPRLEQAGLRPPMKLA